MMGQISAKTWKELNGLSDRDLLELFSIMKIKACGLIDGKPYCRDDMLLILSTENEKDIKAALYIAKKNREATATR